MPLGRFYKWEDNNHGLDHKCGVCKTVLSSPRAKKSCLGLHEEVCTRYHKTLFFLGQSHHCDACHKTDEVHDKRHREILKFIQNIKKKDGLATGASPFPGGKKKAERSKEQHRKGSSTSGRALAEEDLFQRRESPDAQSITSTDDQSLEKRSFEEWDDSSTLDEDGDGQRRYTQVNLACTPGGRKAAKAERRRAKYQTDIETVSRKDLQELYDALHPGQSLMLEQKRQDASQGLAQNEAIENNRAFTAHTFKYHRMRPNAHDKQIMKANHDHKELPNSLEQKRALIDPVLQRLGLNTNLVHATKERKNLDSKLREAVYVDIMAVTNEQTETMQRMAGYWRYASRRTYNAMVRRNELWDWATGEKLPEIEEEIDRSDIDGIEGDHTLECSTDKGPFSKQAESYDSDIDLSEDMTVTRLTGMSDENLPKPVFDGLKTAADRRGLREGDSIIYAESSHTEGLTHHHGHSTGLIPASAFPSRSSVNIAWDRSNVIPERDREKPILKQPTGRDNVSQPSSTWTTKTAKATKRNPATSTSTTSTANEGLLSNNRFKGLNIETAVPNETIELASPPAYHGSKSSSKPSSSKAKHTDKDDFPPLPSSTSTKQPIEPTSDPTPKSPSKSPKILTIGIEVVRLSEAKKNLNKQM